MARKGLLWLSLLPLLGAVYGCSSNSDYIRVILLEGDGYSCANNSILIKRGEDASFSIHLEDGVAITSSSYGEYSIEQLESRSVISFSNVLYPVRISLETSEDLIFYWPDYIDDESPISSPKYNSHLRENALSGLTHFSREGYIQTGWNTGKEGSGEWIPLGGRIPYGVDNLFAVWEKVDDGSLYSYEPFNEGVSITGYSGSSESLCIPSTIDGYDVIGISSGALVDVKATSLTLPPTMVNVATNSLPNVTRLTIYDSLRAIHDSSFPDRSNLVELRVNAIEKPRLSATYWDAFADKIDYLDSVQDEKKLILFSGSSGRYGYDSEQLMEAYPEYEVINFGTFAYINMFPQLELIKTYLKEGDVILHAPEFDAIDYQFCLYRAIDYRFFYCIEADYGSLTKLDIRRFDSLFDAFSMYQNNRHNMNQMDYRYAAKWYDDDFNHYTYPTYNVYGDMTLIRPNHETDTRIMQPLCDYTSDAISQEHFASLNAYYAELEQMGLDIYFSYAPKNIRCLTSDSTEEEIARLDEVVKENIDVSVISDIFDYLYQGYYFYLVDNHLSDEGVGMRMESIIADLSPYIG